MIINDIKIPYDKCRKLINDGDVLLFRGGPLFGISWWISRYTNTAYSHSALAHWHKDRLMCLEFREFCGSREHPVSNYIREGRNIDVFRACPKIEVTTIDCSEPNDPKLKTIEYRLTQTIIDNIIKTAHALLGQKYSYWTIWQFLKTFIPFIRLFKNRHKYEELDTKKFVCSTLVSYSYRKNYVDPVPYLPDCYTTPGDLARSNLFVKLFQIV